MAGLVDFEQGAYALEDDGFCQWCSVAELLWYARDCDACLTARSVVKGCDGEGLTFALIGLRTRRFLFATTGTAARTGTTDRLSPAQDAAFYILKRCPVLGPERVLMAGRVDYTGAPRGFFLRPRRRCHASTPCGVQLGLPL